MKKEYFSKKKLHLFTRHLQQNWWAENTPGVAGRLILICPTRRKECVVFKSTPAEPLLAILGTSFSEKFQLLSSAGL